MANTDIESHWDWIIIGSGFGGSVSALRLVDKGYSVLTLEKGRRFSKDDFPRTNWNLRDWLWRPEVGMRGIFQMSFMRHITVLHGVGVGGGSLVYGNTLPTPPPGFFAAASWAHLVDDWRAELEPHYQMGRRMLGAARFPGHTRGDEVLQEIAQEMGRPERYEKTQVAVYFGEPGVEVDDPYFGGEGPRRTGCIHCGACMTGCRFGAKNTLDLNYLYLAEKRGLRIEPETEVTWVAPDPRGGYRVETESSRSQSLLGRLGRGERQRRVFHADNVVFAGGVMGTVPLLLRLAEDPKGLPRLSRHVGQFVRTNNEALLAIVQPDPEVDVSTGVAITSILHTDDFSHLEPVRYGAGSGFFRLLGLPHTSSESLARRLVGAMTDLASHPVGWAKAYTVADWARQTQVLLYMRTHESTLALRLGRDIYSGFRRGLVSHVEPGGEAPTAFMPEAAALARRWAEKVDGMTMTLLTESVLGTPTTAHILGGACMGTDPESGVIDSDHRVFGYDGLYVIDGAAVSANPGVNPSLTITALAERAMSRIPPKGSAPRPG